MRLEEILLLIATNMELYAFSVLLNAVLCYFFFRRYVNSFLDPFFFRVIGVCFANAIPIFMFLCDALPLSYFLSFLLIETCFWLGFALIKRNDVLLDNLEDSEKYSYVIFCISSIIIVLFRIFFYINYGLPLLMENRADKYEGDAAGLGGLDRLTYILEIFCLLYSFSHYSDPEKFKRLYSRLYIALYALFCLFEGSKSALLLVIIPLYFYVTFIKKISIKLLYIGLSFIAILLVSVIVIIIQGESSELALISLGYRFMMFGDVYYEGFGNDVVQNVVINNPIKDLLVNLLAPFRLMDYTDGVDVPPTIQIHRFVYPELGEINGGPNNRVPLLYYCLFGTWIGAGIALLTGYITSFVMYKSITFFRKSLMGVSMYASLYYIGCMVCTDPILAISYLPSFIIGFLFTLLIYQISPLYAKD